RNSFMRPGNSLADPNDMPLPGRGRVGTAGCATKRNRSLIGILGVSGERGAIAREADRCRVSPRIHPSNMLQLSGSGLQVDRYFFRLVPGCQFPPTDLGVEMSRGTVHLGVPPDQIATI